MDTAVGDMLRAVDGRALMGSAALALCVLDYLAYLRPVHKKNGPNYKQLVEDYLSKINPAYKPAEIYALRCAMLHTYAEAEAMKKAGLTGFLAKHRDPFFHLASTPGTLKINVDTFVADVVWSTRGFFIDTDGDQIVEQNADGLIIVHDPRQGVVAGFAADAEMEKRSYGSMHPVLRELDRSAPDLLALRLDVSAIYPNRTSTSSPPVSGYV